MANVYCVNPRPHSEVRKFTNSVDFILLVESIRGKAEL
jgi:hypothetical protein